ncbi:thioesterase family protein [Sphingomonas naphthae]|uniref:Thioesterase family protein n=1 Tax=Sphingomonas naphthae TaxID=1813468 RepID=A0ABY7TJZ3_9SPHN|nr:acyl-CoA thioesterase domain-containing protein [Sphingomonas naphthae]WCT73537.1 thioesterase family protein [Sphingomonas naphthae]
MTGAASGGKGIGAADLLRLDQTGPLRFRALHNQDNGTGAIFGGQPIAQGLAAAQRTVPDWPVHSATGYYLRAGAIGVPVDYTVEVLRDGRRFASRRVLAEQAGRAIFEMLCSFHDAEDGPVHQHAVPPAMPDPETLPDIADFMRAHADRLPAILSGDFGLSFPIDLRLPDAEAAFFSPPASAERNYWMRMRTAAMLDDPAAHQCLLAFMSDFWVAATPGAPHLRVADAHRMATVTLNHSLWFHGATRADEWLLCHTESPWAGEGRGLVRGAIHDARGRLVASVTQDVSMRRL